MKARYGTAAAAAKVAALDAIGADGFEDKPGVACSVGSDQIQAVAKAYGAAIEELLRAQKDPATIQLERDSAQRVQGYDAYEACAVVK